MFLNVILTLYNLGLVIFLLYQGTQSEATAANFLLLALLLPVLLHFLLRLAGRVARWKPRRLQGLFLTGSLITTTLIAALNLLGVRSTADYPFALAILPLPLYFWRETLANLLRILNQPKFEGRVTGAAPPLAWEDQLAQARAERERREAILPNLATEPAPAESPAEEGVTDPDRRAFLKKIGGVGLGILAYSLLNPKQAGAAFFGSVPGPGTVAIKDTTDTKIDPAIKGLQSLTIRYGVSEIDDGDPAYYGFVDKDGGWYILKEDETEGDFSYRYAKGDSDFSSNWSNRTGLFYQYFDQVF